MTVVDIIVPCPFCRCPSSIYMTLDRDGGAWIMHDCQQCGHREDNAVQTALGWARGAAAGYLASHPERWQTAAEACKAIHTAVGDIEPVARDVKGRWYGCISRRYYDLPAPEDGCDRYDPRWDHYYGQGAEE